MLCSRFQNNTFWTDFEKRVTLNQEDISEAIENFKEMVQDCIQDYFVNQDAQRSYFLLSKLDSKLQDLFDSLENSKPGENELELLSQLQHQINEDESLKQIKDAISYKSQNNDVLYLTEEKQSDEKSPMKLKKRSSPGLSLQKFRRRSTAATERGSHRVPDLSSGKKVIKDALTMGEKNSSGEVSAERERKVELETLFDSDEEEDKVQVLKMTKLRLERILTHSEHKGISSIKSDAQEEYIYQSMFEINIDREPQNVDDNVPQIKEKFFELLAKMREDFEEQRLEDAIETKQALKEHVTSNSSDEQLKEWFNLYLQANYGFLSELDLWNKEIQNVVKHLNEEEGYHNYETTKNYTVKYKTSEKGKTIMKMESIVETSLVNVLSIMYEANGFNKWVPFCKESKLVKPLHRATFAYWLRYGLPAPLSDRECYCLGIGVDRLKKNGSILLISRSVESDHEILKRYKVEVPKKTKNMPLDIHVGTEIVPLSENKVKVRIVMDFDAHVKYTSNGILKWASKKVAKSMFKNLLVKSKNLKGTFWEKRMTENKEFYQWLEEKINKTHPSTN